MRRISKLLPSSDADADEGADAEARGDRRPRSRSAPAATGAVNVVPSTRERTHRLLVVEAGVDAVARLHVELHEVDVHADLAERVVGVVAERRCVRGHVDAVLAGVGPDGQRLAQRRDRRATRLRAVRGRTGLRPESTRLSRALSGTGSSMASIANVRSVVPAGHSEPSPSAPGGGGRPSRRRPVDVRAPGRGRARTADAPRDAVAASGTRAPCRALEQDPRAYPRGRRPVARPDRGRLGLADDHSVLASSSPTPRRRSLSARLPGAAESVARDERVGRQRVGCHRGLDGISPVGQRRQRRQRVGRRRAVLERVVHPPDPPHAGEVVVGDVAVVRG